jgi:hypothetical protein
MANPLLLEGGSASLARGLGLSTQVHEAGREGGRAGLRGAVVLWPEGTGRKGLV